MTRIPPAIRGRWAETVRAALVDTGRPDIADSLTDDGSFGVQFVNREDAGLIYRAHVVACQATAALATIPCFPCWVDVGYRDRIAACPEVDPRFAITLERHPA